MNSNQYSELHFAVVQKSSSCVEKLILAGQDLGARDKLQFTPLMTAGYHNCTECASRLLECGANVSQEDGRGDNTLHLTSKHGYFSIATLLVEYGSISILKMIREQLHYIRHQIMIIWILQQYL